MGKIVWPGLVVVAFLLGVYVGYTPQTARILENALPEPTPSVTREAAPQPATDEGVVVETRSLSPSQQKLLSTLGIDASTIVITTAMIACAEAKVGAARLKEIEGGATPSMSEGFSLLGCYRQ